MKKVIILVILATSVSTTFNDPKAVSAHFLATKVYDFYKEKI